VTKYQRTQKRKDLFRLMVSEISATQSHGFIVSVSVVEPNIKEKLFTSQYLETKKGLGKISPSRASPQWPPSSNYAPPPKGCTTFQ
jgi:hypothetical protein